MAVMMSDESGSFDVEHLEDFDISGILEVRADNRREVAEAVDGAIAAALEEVGLAAEGFAKRLCPVDTGRLRNSITHVTRPDDNAVYIGTNVEYAPYVEYGTARQEAQPFLRPAATRHGDTYRTIVEAHLRG